MKTALMETSVVKIALIQSHLSSDIKANLDKYKRMIQLAKDGNADIICLPELFATPYFAKVEDKAKFNLAEPIPGKLSNFLKQQAKKYQVNIIGGSIYEKSTANHYYNTCLIINKKGQLTNKYRKMHIPQDPNYYERFYFTPGNLGYIQTKLNDIQVAPLICYDQWFPEPARILALNGVHIIFYPTAIGWFPQLQKDEPFSAQRWEDVMRAHASMNGIFVAACNRVGKEGNMDFWGGSFVADPFGQVMAKASSASEEILFAEINTEKVFDSQGGWGFLKYRRPDSYDCLVEKKF